MHTRLFALSHVDYHDVDRHLLREVDAACLARLRLLTDTVEDVRRTHGLADPEITFDDPQVTIIKTELIVDASPDLQAALENTRRDFASTFITQELADELLGYDDLIVAIASSRAVVSRLGVSWEAENPYEVRVRASGLTRADLIHGLLALAPEAQLGSLLDELAEEVPAHLLRVLEKGVEVAGAEARNVKPWVSRDAFVRLATHHDREVRERAILLASDLEVPRRLPRR